MRKNKKKRKPKGFWNDKNAVLSEARKYDGVTEFYNAAVGAYSSAKRNGWLQEATKHMKRKLKPKGYWTRERIHKLAIKFKTRKSFENKHPYAYEVARKKGFINDVCSHMEYIVLPKGYWTLEMCRNEAIKYQTRYSFEKGSSKAYFAAYKKGWLDEVCSHMVSPQKSNGYWNSKGRVAKEALKYETRSDFAKKSAGAYDSAHKKGWLDDVCRHMKGKESKYTFEYCIERAKAYKTRKEFRINERAAYARAIKEGWLKEVYSYLPEHVRPKKWSKEDVRNIAIKYQNKRDFNRFDKAAFSAAVRHGWRDEVCSHMVALPNKFNSVGESKIACILDSYGIRYTREQLFDGCVRKRKLPFDFYLSSHNMCIEYHGEQHYRPIEFFGGNDRFVIRKECDQIKRDFCNKSGICLIEIPYWDYSNIEDILTKKLTFVGQMQLFTTHDL